MHAKVLYSLLALAFRFCILCWLWRSVKMTMRHRCLPSCDLPDELIEEIMVWLPMESLCKFRLVSKQCNDLISSTKFITTKWADAPPNRMPWLVLMPWMDLPWLDLPNSRTPDPWAYCFFTRAWRKTSSISISFLSEEYGDECEIQRVNSATGIFLAEIGPPFNVLTVCNPLTRKSLQLPPFSSIRTISARGIVGNSPDTYTVVAVGESSPDSAETVEIYDSTEKSWRIAGQLPEDSENI